MRRSAWNAPRVVAPPSGSKRPMSAVVSEDGEDVIGGSNGGAGDDVPDSANPAHEYCGSSNGPNVQARRPRCCRTRRENVMNSDLQRKMATAAIHAGEIHDPSGAHIAPIYQTSTFTFEDMGAVKAWSEGETDGYIYSRVGNPNRTALARKLAALESIGLGAEQGAVTAEIFGSGMAAVSAALMSLAKAGDHIITQKVLYGSADGLISNVLPTFGITNSRITGLESEALEREFALHPNTTAVYVETPANPTMKLIDIAGTAEIAHAHGARVVVDNTFATPVLQRPLEHGADVVVHSTTKYINGHGTVVGGAIVTRDPVLMEEGVGPLVRFMGGIPSPFDCWLTNIGLKTLPLRMARHCTNGMAVAEFLAAHPAVTAVHYPGLPSDPQHDLAVKQMDGFG